jgi:hypothetical protein
LFLSNNLLKISTLSDYVSLGVVYLLYCFDDVIHQALYHYTTSFYWIKLSQIINHYVLIFIFFLCTCWIPSFILLPNLKSQTTMKNPFNTPSTIIQLTPSLAQQIPLYDIHLTILMTSIDDIARIVFCLHLFNFFSLLPAGVIVNFQQRSSKILYIYQFSRELSL